MSFNTHWTISSSNEFQAHQQHSQRRCCFSQTALLWFEALPAALLCKATRHLGDRKRVILRQRVRGSVRAVRAIQYTWVFLTETTVGADELISIWTLYLSELVWDSRISWATVPGAPKLLTTTPMVLPYQPSEIPVTPIACWTAHPWSGSLLKLTLLSLHSAPSQTILEAPSNQNMFCWWSYGSTMALTGCHRFGSGVWAMTMSAWLHFFASGTPVVGIVLPQHTCWRCRTSCWLSKPYSSMCDDNVDSPGFSLSSWLIFWLESSSSYLNRSVTRKLAISNTILESWC
jgi:hypothetical protein